MLVHVLHTFLKFVLFCIVFVIVFVFVVVVVVHICFSCPPASIDTKKKHVIALQQIMKLVLFNTELKQIDFSKKQLSFLSGLYLLKNHILC